MVAVGRPAFRVKRPIDKQLIVVNSTVTTGAQTNTTLFTATFPCTIVGLRWVFGARAGGSGVSDFFWCVHIVRQGNTIPLIATASGGTFVAPEQNVLTYGVHALNNAVPGPSTIDVDGATKTMRKLMGGDQLFWSGRSDVNNTEVVGVIQFFCKL